MNLQNLSLNELRQHKRKLEHDMKDSALPLNQFTVINKALDTVDQKIKQLEDQVKKITIL